MLYICSMEQEILIIEDSNREVEVYLNDYLIGTELVGGVNSISKFIESLLMRVGNENFDFKIISKNRFGSTSESFVPRLGWTGYEKE